MKSLIRNKWNLEIGFPLLKAFFSSNYAKKKKLGVCLVCLGKYSTENLAPALMLTKYCQQIYMLNLLSRRQLQESMFGVQKPMATSSLECLAMIESCKKNNVHLSIGYRMQHEPNTRKMMAWVIEKRFLKMNSMVKL